MSGDTGIIFYRDGYKAQLYRTYVIQTCIAPEEPIVTDFYAIEPCGLMTIHKGYCWDFATGALDTQTIIRASLIHDVGCQAIVDGLLDIKHKPQVDNEFNRICAKDGMGWFRRWYTFMAVSRFSCKGKPKKVKSAPDAHIADKFNFINNQGAA